MPLLFDAVEVVLPDEKTPLVAVNVGEAVAPALPSILQLSMVLLSFPLAPVVVLNKITPDEAEGNVDLSTAYRNVLFEASLINLTADPPVAVLVLMIVRNLLVPVPPGLPSIVTLAPPFISIVAVVLALVIVSVEATVASGLTVIDPRGQGEVVNVIGKVSLPLVYALCNSKITEPVVPDEYAADNAAVNVRYVPVGPTE